MVELLICGGELPVLHEFVLVELRLGKHELELSARQGAAHDASATNVDKSIESSVASVKVRGVVVVVVHQILIPRKIEMTGIRDPLQSG